MVTPLGTPFLRTTQFCVCFHPIHLATNIKTPQIQNPAIFFHEYKNIAHFPSAQDVLRTVEGIISLVVK